MDLEDLKRIEEFGGTGLNECKRTGYWFFNKGGRKYRVHRFIMRAPKGIQVDHIHGDKSDNRKHKLRLCSNSENHMNQKRRSDNKAGYPGVSPRGDKWRAGICVKGKRIDLGYHSWEQAVLTRRKAELIYFGEYRMKKIPLKVWRIKE